MVNGDFPETRQRKAQYDRQASCKGKRYQALMPLFNAAVAATKKLLQIVAATMKEDRAELKLRCSSRNFEPELLFTPENPRPCGERLDRQEDYDSDAPWLP